MSPRLRRTPLRPRSREPRSTPEQMREHGFHDARSRVLWSTGRVELRGVDMTALRRRIYARSRGLCEAPDATGPGGLCSRFAPWDGWKHGELSHLVHGAKGPGDVLANVIWSCPGCHRKRHPGPQFSWRKKA